MSDTVVARLRERAARFASNVALIEGTSTWTYGALFSRAARLASALRRLGVHKGDAILAWLPNTHEAVECELAALGSGHPWITLTARLTWAEVRGVVASCAPKIIVTNPDGLRRLVEGFREFPLPSLPELILTEADGATASPFASYSYESYAYETLLAGEGASGDRADIGPEDVARLRYTSGTTGSARAAVLPQRVYAASLETLLHELGPFTPADRALHAAPLTHGSGALMYPVFYAGGANVLMRHFDVEDVLASIERHRITTLFTVPTMLSRLVAAKSFDRRDLSSLRALVYGGAPMPAAQLDKAVEKIGRALYQIYGMTEAPWPITNLKPPDHVPGSPRLRSVGRPSRGYEVRIAGPDGAALPAGQVGEITVRGDNVMSGYLADLAGTRAVLRDGSLSTGDLGRIDEDGYVFIVGRKKDVIISGGFNVYAAEVEAAISELDGVLEVAVLGLPHEDWGELVAAFVVPKPSVTLRSEEIDAFVRTRLSSYKCPRRIEIVADLPKNASGKIQKSQIALARE